MSARTRTKGTGVAAASGAAGLATTGLGAAIAADVSDNPVASQTRRLFLARTGRRMRADYFAICWYDRSVSALRCKPMKQLFIYGAAALAEIGGCFAFWAWLRMDKSPIWLIPGMLSLALFAWLLTLSDAVAAGRTYAAYGGIYILASLFWLWAVEDMRPDRWDAIGATICLLGAAIILYGP